MKSVCLQGILKQSFSLSPNKFDRIFPTKFNGSSDQSSDADQFNTTLGGSSGPDGALKKINLETILPFLVETQSCIVIPIKGSHSLMSVDGSAS